MNTMTTRPPHGAAPMGAGAAHVPYESRSLLRYMTYTDPLALLVWVLVTTVPNDWAAPVRYLCVAYFAGGLVLFARQTLPTYIRSWPTLIIPVMCVISAIWAPSANDAIRKGVFMGLTGAIAIYAASRLNVRQIVAIYFLGETVGALLSIVNPNLANGSWTGVFGQKNFLAVHMFILYTTGLAILLDKQSLIWLRAMALFFIPLAMTLIFLSKSATTLMLLIGATGALAGHKFLWQPAIRIPHMRTLIIITMLVLGVLAGLMLFGLFQLDATDTMLKALGKDSTLTGRTFIWDMGHRVMNEHPLTGVGADGFWRPERGIANQITTFFFYEHFVKFSFHNSYIENGVQLGYPGYYATYFLAGWGLWNCFWTWARNQTLLNAAFLILGVMVLIRSNAEIDLGAELAGTAILFFIGAARKEDLRKPVHAPLVQSSAAPVPVHRSRPRGR